AGDQVIKLLARGHPDARREAFPRQQATFGGGERLRRIAPLVLEQVAQILVRRDAEEPGSARETGGKLEVGDIGTPVPPAQPVLLLGKVVMAGTGPGELPKGGFGGGEKCLLAMRLGDGERQAVDPAPDHRVVGGEQERRRNAEFTRDRQCAPLAREQMARQAATPPWHFVEPAQHRFHLVGADREASAFDGRKQVALDHEAAGPAFLDIARQAHRPYSAAAARSSPLIQRARSASARRASARFFSSVFSLPRSRCPPSPLSAWASGGKRPKLTFIGWYERAVAGVAPEAVSMWPPVICASKAPCAVVGGGGVSNRPSRSAAAKRPAMRPMAAHSTYPPQPLIWPAKRSRGSTLRRKASSSSFGPLRKVLR